MVQPTLRRPGMLITPCSSGAALGATPPGAHEEINENSPRADGHIPDMAKHVRGAPHNAPHVAQERCGEAAPRGSTAMEAADRLSYDRAFASPCPSAAKMPGLCLLRGLCGNSRHVAQHDRSDLEARSRSNNTQHASHLQIGGPARQLAEVWSVLTGRSLQGKRPEQPKPRQRDRRKPAALG